MADAYSRGSRSGMIKAGLGARTMVNLRNGCAVAALALALPLGAMSSGNAAPLAPSHATSLSAAGLANSDISEVRYRGRGWGGGGVGLGIAAGALLGGAIAAGASPYYYGPGYYYGGPAYYPAPAPVVVDPYYGGDAEAYCMRRYRSYDPASGTYLNYDGNRYPCP
jgi:hypothetical protein